MAQENEMKLAQSVYDTICRMLDDKGFSYKKFEDDLVIATKVNGEDIPIDILIFVHAKQQVVRILSPMPFDVPEEKRIDMAVAVNVANFGIVDGSFDYNIADGNIRFRITASYRDSILSKNVFEYMFMTCAVTTDDYNDKFMMLAKGMISLEQFLKAEK